MKYVTLKVTTKWGIDIKTYDLNTIDWNNILFTAYWERPINAKWNISIMEVE